MCKDDKKYIFKELLANDSFNPKSINSSAEFTQANFYGEWQKGLNKEVRRFVIYNKKQEVLLYMQVIECYLPFGKKYYTCPYGPIYKDDEINEKLLIFLKDKINTVLGSSRNVVFTRLDFSPTLNERHSKLIQRIFTKAHWTSVHGSCFQPRREWMLPLEKPEEEILASMHQKTRYNIRLSERKNIKIEIATENLINYLEDFYKVQSITATRNGFQLHEKEYYASVLESCDKNKNGYLAIARLDGKILTINFMIVYNNIAMFAFGGSVNEHRNLMPSYYAHWEGAKYAKSIGMKYYNFGGYFDKDGPRTKKSTLKKRSQFSIFKKKFGGFALEHSDFYDIVHNKLWYMVYIMHKFFRHA